MKSFHYTNLKVRVVLFNNFVKIQTGVISFISPLDVTLRRIQKFFFSSITSKF